MGLAAAMDGLAELATGRPAVTVSVCCRALALLTSATGREDGVNALMVSRGGDETLADILARLVVDQREL
eukprot:4300744-Prymnesium_polylepis.1